MLLQNWKRTQWKSQKATLKSAWVAANCQLFLQAPCFSVVQHRAPATTKALKPEIESFTFGNEGRKTYPNFFSESSLAAAGTFVQDGTIVTQTYLCVVETRHPYINAGRHYLCHVLTCLPETLVVKRYVISV